jgi:hypothetical protein
MTYENGAYGRSNPVQTIIAVRLKRIADSQPTAWEGETLDGDKVHIAYRFGEVSVDVRCPTNGEVGTWTWHRVARFSPGLIAAEIEGKDESDRYARRLMARRAMITEIRRANEADMKSRASRLDRLDPLLSDRLIIRNGQLAKWLEIRNRNLELLSARGVAGGVVPVEVRFAA